MRFLARRRPRARGRRRAKKRKLHTGVVVAYDVRTDMHRVQLTGASRRRLRRAASVAGSLGARAGALAGARAGTADDGDGDGDGGEELLGAQRADASAVVAVRLHAKRYFVTTESRNWLRAFIYYDTVMFVLVAAGFAFTFTQYIETSETWQVNAALYWARVLYSLTMWPYLAIRVPLCKTVLTHARETGYNAKGTCVPQRTSYDWMTPARSLLPRALPLAPRPGDPKLRPRPRFRRTRPVDDDDDDDRAAPRDIDEDDWGVEAGDVDGGVAQFV